MISYTSDFEQGLANSLEAIFPNVRRLGCFYHYSRNIRKNIKERVNIEEYIDDKDINLTEKKIKENIENFINDILMIPFEIQKNENIIENIYNKYKLDYLIKFKNYFSSKWEPIIKNGILNYAYATKEQRSNIFIENYNKRIKTELCKFNLFIILCLLAEYIYGRSKTKIAWPLFLKFIKSEEEYFRLRVNHNLSEIPKKNNNIKIIKTIIENKNEIKEFTNVNDFIWFKNRNSSCRYDSFLLLYMLKINNNIDTTIKLDVIVFYNNIINSIQLLDNIAYNKGVWDILDKLLEDPYNFKNKGYKIPYSISQLISPLENNNIFSFNIKKMKLCFKCQFKEELNIFYGPIIQFNVDDLDLTLTECFEKRFQNKALICPNCGWNNNKIITKYATFSEIITEINNPNFIFIFYDIGNEKDDLFSVVNNIRNYLDKITSQIVNNFSFKNDAYKLAGIICCPYNGHYTCIVIDIDEDIKNIKKGRSYFYDDCSREHNLTELKDYRSIFKNHLPYICLYIKNKSKNN